MLTLTKKQPVVVAAVLAVSKIIRNKGVLRLTELNKAPLLFKKRRIDHGKIF